jgi:hypothetical protein
MDEIINFCIKYWRSIFLIAGLIFAALSVYIHRDRLKI